MSWKKIAAVIMALTFVVYLPSFTNAFVWDDEQFIYKNQYVLTFDLPNIFSHNTIAGAGQVSNYYRPLVTLGFALDHLLWGLNPIGFHLTNTLLHMATGGFLMLIFWLLEKIRHPDRNVTFRTQPLIWLVPLVFLLHPLQTEAVTYMNSRGDSQYTFWLTLSLVLFLRTWLSHPLKLHFRKDTFEISHPTLLAAAVVSFTAALLSKEIALAGLGLFWLVWGWANVSQVQFRFSSWFKNRSQFLALLVVTSIGFLYLGARATVLNFQNSFNFYAGQTEYAQSLSKRLGTFSHAYWLYQQLLVIPYPLHMERSVPVQNSLFNYWTLLLLVAQVFWLVAGRWEWKQKKTGWIWFGLGWWWCMMAPVTGVIPINGLMYEHWLYLPLVGWFLSWLRLGLLSWKKFGPKRFPAWFSAQYFFIWCGCCVVLTWIGLTIRQNYLWGDPVRFYEYTLRYAQTARLFNNLGMAYAEKKQYQQALTAYQEALKTDPYYSEIHHNLGEAYLKLNQPHAAVAAYKKAIELNPQFFYSYGPLINLYLEQRELDHALSLIQTLHAWYPDDPQLTKLQNSIQTERSKMSPSSDELKN